MKKILIISSLIAVLLISLVQATHSDYIDVNCNSPEWWNTVTCQDHELQDEFDEVVDRIDHVKWKSKIGDWKLWKYIGSNEEDWLRDEKGSDNSGGGFSEARLGDYLVGDKLFFHNWEGTFLDFLDNIFVTHKELEEQKEYTIGLEKRIYDLQRRVYELETQGEEE